MEKRPDRKTGYRDVKSLILQYIRSRRWRPGELLPAEVDLAAEFGCARATVNRAMRELSDEGIIDRKRKIGTRVNLAPVRQVRFDIPLVRAEIEAMGASYRYSLAARQIGPAPDWLRARLRLPENARVINLRCMHYADGAPYQFENRWINLETVPAAETADFASIGPNEWLVREVPFTDIEVQFSASAATQELADFLMIAPGEPVFTAARTTWLDKKPVTNTALYFHRGYKMVARY